MKQRWFSLLGTGIMLSACKSSYKSALPQELTIALSGDIACLDPRKSNEPNMCSVMHMLFEGLMTATPQNKVIPAAAQFIHQSPDHTSYLIRLKSSLRWSNQAQVTAYDFEYAWKTLLSPSFNAPFAFLLYHIKNAQKIKLGECPDTELGITVFNEREFSITLEHPAPYFLELLSFPCFFPVYHKVTDETAVLPTNGPFLLTQWQKNNELVFEKNPYFHDKRHVSLDKVRAVIINNFTTALQLFETKAVDWFNSGMQLSPPEFLAAHPNFPAPEATSLLGTFFLAFNTTTPPFDRMEMRQAFSVAIDRNTLSQCLAYPTAQSLVPPNFTTHPTSLPLNTLQESQRWLKEALATEPGLRKMLEETTLYYAEGGTMKQVAEILQSQWQAVFDVKIRLQAMTFKIFLDALYNRNYAMALTGIIAQYSDPMNFLERFLYANNSKNYSGWENNEYIQCVEAAKNASEQSEREILYRQAENILLENAPVAPLFYYKDFYFITPKARGFFITPTGVYFQHITLSEDLPHVPAP